jgi:hypothetical protein
MVLIKRIEQIEAFDWDAGAIMARAKQNNFVCGYVVGEIGLIVYGYGGRDAWVVVMSGGYHSQAFGTLRQLVNSFTEWGQLDFFHIEIKP